MALGVGRIRSFGPQFSGILVLLLLTNSVSLFGADEFVADEILIRFRDSTPTQEITAFEKNESLTFLNEISTIKVRLYRLSQGADVTTAVRRFTQNPIVEFAEPNYARKASSVNDPYYSSQWSLHNTGQRVNGVSGQAGVDIRWPEAMALFTGNTPVTVAVIDSGVALDHPDILPHAFVNSAELNGIGGVDDDHNGYVDDFSGYDFYAQNNVALDENGHGTLVASIIAGASNNGIGGAGICPNARIMSLRVLNQFGRGGLPKFARVSDVALALDYALRNGAKIVNLSLGGSSFSATELLILRSLDSGGVLVVAAAGNGGDDGIGDNNDVIPFYPASYAVNNIIAVAAQDRSGGLALFSNYGVRSVQIAAPGTQIFGANITRRTVFSENFQGAAPGWTVGSANGNLSPYTWSIGTSGSQRVLTDRLTGATYAPLTNTFARSPFISLNGTLGARLTFDVDFDLADDFLYIDVSADGTNWITYDYTSGSSELNWSTHSVDISDFDGGAGYFRFRLASNSSNQGLGVAIDNVSITSVTVLDSGTPQFQYEDGTSFSAPMVAGVAALVMSQRPDLSTSLVRSIILSSARPVTALSGKVATGGMLDAEHALQLANASSASNPGRLVNLSVISRIQGTLAMGFVIGGPGSGTENMLIRGIGPALAAFGVTEFLPDPTLSVVQQNTHAILATNSGWGAPLNNQSQVLNADAATGAFPLADVASKDAALVIPLVISSGGYTVQIAGKTGDAGTTLAEVYDYTPNYTVASPRLVNLSCLTQVNAGGSLSAGFVIGGSTALKVLVRATGPALTRFGVGGEMPDPQIVVQPLGSNNVLASNAGWAGNNQITSAGNSVGAFQLTNPASRDSAVLLTLAPGPYTAQVSSVSGVSGKTLVEIYEIP